MRDQRESSSWLGLTNVRTITNAGHVVKHVAWSPDGARLAIAFADHPTWIVDSQSDGRPLALEESGAPVRFVVWSPDGRLVASSARDKIMRFWDSETGRIALTIPSPTESVIALSWSPDRKTVHAPLVMGQSPTREIIIRSWDVKTAKPYNAFQDPSWKKAYGGRSKNFTAVSADRRFLALTFTDGSIQVWDLSRVHKLVDCQVRYGPVYSVAVAPDLQTVVLALDDGALLVVDSSSRQMAQISAHGGLVYGLSFSHNGTLLASKSSDGAVSLWHMGTMKHLARFQEPAVEGREIEPVFDPARMRLATCDEEASIVTLWEMGNMSESDLSSDEMTENGSARTSVFVSYSHEDQEWLAKLRTFLKPYEKRFALTVWADTGIQPGALWKQEIAAALATARVGVLLVSPAFLASDFIDKHELPQLLQAAQEGGTEIAWIAVRHSSVRDTHPEIAQYQSVSTDPGKPLASMSPSEQDRELTEICKKINALGRKST